jgi:hypothetical protein
MLDINQVRKKLELGLDGLPMLIMICDEMAHMTPSFEDYSHPLRGDTRLDRVAPVLAPGSRRSGRWPPRGTAPRPDASGTASRCGGSGRRKRPSPTPAPTVGGSPAPWRPPSPVSARTLVSQPRAARPRSMTLTACACTAATPSGSTATLRRRPAPARAQPSCGGRAGGSGRVRRAKRGGRLPISAQVTARQSIGAMREARSGIGNANRPRCNNNGKPTCAIIVSCQTASASASTTWTSARQRLSVTMSMPHLEHGPAARTLRSATSGSPPDRTCRSTVEGSGPSARTGTLRGAAANRTGHRRAARRRGGASAPKGHRGWSARGRVAHARRRESSTLCAACKERREYRQRGRGSRVLKPRNTPITLWQR